MLRYHLIQNHVTRSVLRAAAIVPVYLLSNQKPADLAGTLRNAAPAPRVDIIRLPRYGATNHTGKKSEPRSAPMPVNVSKALKEKLSPAGLSSAIRGYERRFRSHERAGHTGLVMVRLKYK